MKYLREAPCLLDDWTVEVHTNVFGIAELNKLGAHGTETTWFELVRYVRGLKKRLRRETNQVNAVIRLVINAICEINSSKKENLRDLTNLLKKRKTA